VKALLIPIGSHGDVHPFVGLGLALRGRGHDVTVLTFTYFEKTVRAAGLDFVGLPLTEDFDEGLKNPDLWHPRRAFTLVMQKSVLPYLRPIYDAVTERYVPGETVVVPGSLAFGARVAQDKLGIPTANVHLQPVLFRSEYHAPILPPTFMPDWLPRFAKRLQYRLANALVVEPVLTRGLNAFRAEVGLPPVHDIMGGWWHSPQRVVGLFPDWYGPPQPDWPPQVRLTGFPLYDEREVRPPSPELDDFLRAGEPPVVFTAGSAMRQGHGFFAEAAQACRLSGRRGILLTRFPEQLPARLPENVRHFAYVPFSQVLPRAAAFVHHGGIGTTAQALAAGVPHLVMPLAHDQPDNADRLRRLGVARVLPPARFRAPAVARALDDLLASADVAARCRDYAGRIRTARPLDEACRLIEELAGTDSLPSPPHRGRGVGGEGACSPRET
jgi:UDP:flavonoid glycosyltransferase YjiC (YdhE family)